MYTSPLNLLKEPSHYERIQIPRYISFISYSDKPRDFAKWPHLPNTHIITFPNSSIDIWRGQREPHEVSCSGRNFVRKLPNIWDWPILRGSVRTELRRPQHEPFKFSCSVVILQVWCSHRKLVHQRILNGWYISTSRWCTNTNRNVMRRSEQGKSAWSTLPLSDKQFDERARIYPLKYCFITTSSSLLFWLSWLLLSNNGRRVSLHDSSSFWRNSQSLHLNQDTRTRQERGVPGFSENRQKFPRRSTVLSPCEVQVLKDVEVWLRDCDLKYCPTVTTTYDRLVIF